MSVPPPPGSLPPPLTGAAAAALPPQQRPNPAYQQLYATYQETYGSIGRLRRALRPAVQTLRGTDAWLGPEAREWGDRLDDGHRRLQRAADRILWDVYNALSSTDRLITRG